MASETPRVDCALCQPRVLIVEDEASVRADHIKNLTRWGYRPIAAEGRGQTLLRDAVAKARAWRCHIALVDMRLLNHDNQKDQSGLDLISQLKPTLGIIVSGYGDPDTVRAALKEKDAVDFVVKQAGPERLKAVLENVLGQACACARGLTIEWPAGMSSAGVGRGFFPSDPSIPGDEANDVLGRLFDAPGTLRLQTIAQRSRSPGHTRSLILKAWHNDLQPVVVKLARVQRIEAERQRYRDHIEGKLAGRFYARLERSVVLWDLGGIVYEFLGSPLGAMQLFSRYYAAAPAKQIGHTLDHLFGATWGEHYRAAVVSGHPSLFEAYTGVWGREWHARLLRFAGPPICFDALGLCDPVRWVCARVGLRGGLDTSPRAPFYQALGHGDMLGDNVFVDEYDRTWTLDYERCGPGPSHQDFAELEADILTHLADLPPDDNATFLRLAVAAAQPKLLDQPLAIADEHPGARKALKVVAKLRRLAGAHTGSADAWLYLWGVLFNTVFSATLLGETPEYADRRARALLLGSVICHRLEHWNDPWPPEEWSEARRIR